MRKSQRLRLRDLRDIYRLIGQCRDLGRNWQSWRLHLLHELCTLLGAQVGVGVQGVIDADGEVTPIGPVSQGWRTDEGEQSFQQFVSEEFPCDDIFFARVLSQLQDGALRVTRARPQLLDDRVWLRSEFFNNYPRTAGLNESLYSYCWVPAVRGKVIDGIELHRPLGERAFGQHERRILSWLHHELRPLIGRQLAGPGEPSFAGLGRRLRQTLEFLMQGDSEKQVALRLGLSRATVHEYVTALYRHFGVHSRGELLALWNRFDRT